LDSKGKFSFLPLLFAFRTLLFLLLKGEASAICPLAAPETDRSSPRMEGFVCEEEEGGGREGKK